MLTHIIEHRFWKSQGVVIARILMGGAFLMAAYTKFTDMGQTAMYITSAGFPAPLALAWIAAIFETFCGLAIVFGAYFRQSALLLGAYAVFLAFAFHGPSHWSGSPYELGSFVDHFTLLAGLLFMAAYGPGDLWVFGKKEHEGN